MSTFGVGDSNWASRELPTYYYEHHPTFGLVLVTVIGGRKLPTYYYEHHPTKLKLEEGGEKQKCLKVKC